MRAACIPSWEFEANPRRDGVRLGVELCWLEENCASAGVHGAVAELIVAILPNIDMWDAARPAKQAHFGWLLVVLRRYGANRLPFSLTRRLYGRYAALAAVFQLFPVSSAVAIAP
jgi:hypothetical protein